MTPSKLNLVPLKYKNAFLEYTDACAENVLRLQDIWEDCGIPAEKIDKRMLQMFQWITQIWSTVINDELRSVEEQKKRVQTALEDLADLCLQLDVEMPTLPNGLNLHQQLKWVDSANDSVEAIRAKRQTLYDELRREEAAIIGRMSDKAGWQRPHSVTPHGAVRPLPNDDALREFATHVAMLRDERRIRLDKLRPLVDESCVVMERIGKVPRLPVEEQIASLPADHWDLTLANIKRAAEARDALLTEEAQVQARHSALLTQLSRLFDRLDVTGAERDEHLDGLTLVQTYQTVSRLEELVSEFEELKRANMASYVDKLKNEAKECHVLLRTGQEWSEPAAIQELVQQGPSEELIAAYEQLIGTLKLRQSQLASLFKLLDEREQLLEILKQLEEAQRDPNRYKNRGGALLQETKKRERVNKHLPIVAKQIAAFLDAYEPQHGPVLVQGKWVRDQIRDNNDDKKIRNIPAPGAYSTPLKVPRALPTTPASARPASQLAHRNATFKRAGTYTEIKPKASAFRQTPSARQPQTVGKVYTRHMGMKSPTSVSKSTLSTAKRGLRRSISYGNFENQLSSVEDIHSTRILETTSGSHDSKSRSRRLMF